MHVCWPVGAQTRHIRLSQLPQASHRRLEIAAWASGGWGCGYPKGRLGLKGAMWWPLGCIVGCWRKLNMGSEIGLINGSLVA